MKRIIIYQLLVLCAITLSCTNEKYYRLTILRDNEPYKEIEFTATSDDTAQSYAVEQSNRYMADISRVQGPSLFKSIYDFELFETGRSNNKYRWVGLPRYSIDYVNEETRWAEEEGKKVFAGSTFGMSMKEVAKLPHFHNYIKIGNMLYSPSETIGNNEYLVALNFGNKDQLFYAEFVGKPHENASSINTGIKEEVENFRRVISAAYGNRYEDNGYPSVSYFDDWQVKSKIIYSYYGIGIWKRITIGIVKDFENNQYRMCANIVDNQMSSAEERQTINSAGSLF